MTLDDLNREFAILAVGNKMVVMQNNPDGSIAELWSYEEFKKKLVKEFIKVKSATGVKVKSATGVKVVPLANFWLSSNRGRQYERLIYDLPGSTMHASSKDYNGWLGFAVPPTEGSWELNAKHIHEVICSGDNIHFAWVINWLAALVQLPGRHAWTAIVLRGGRGIGKGHFANNMIGSLFCSQQYLHILGANQLTAEFNEHLSGKSYVFADESTWGGDPRAAAKLKGLVTENTIPIHRKYLKMIEEQSMLHIVIASNNEWPIPIEPDDRRFTVFDVDESRKQDDPYFASLLKELNSGGLSAMLYDLLNYKIDERMLRTPLMTDAKSDITTRSLKHTEHWWLEILESGIIENDVWPDSLLAKDLHRNYLEFLDRHHKTSRESRSTQTELGMFLRKFTPVSHQMTVNGKVERIVFIPSLADCRARWVEAFHWPADYQWDRHSTLVSYLGHAPAKDDPGF